MTTRDVVERVERAYRRGDREGWKLSGTEPWEDYELQLGSGWEMIVRVYRGSIDDGFGLYHDGEVKAILGMNRIKFREDEMVLVGDDRNARIPITQSMPEGDGVPKLTNVAKERLIDLVMGGYYREIDKEETLILDEYGCLRMVLTCTGRPYSLPQVICRITCRDPDGKHPEFDFVGRLDMVEGKVSVCHRGQSITFDIPDETVDTRLEQYPPKVPILRDWLKGKAPVSSDPALSSMREEMECTLRKTCFEPGTVVYL